jgi:hypothetical protein
MLFTETRQTWVMFATKEIMHLYFTLLYHLVFELLCLLNDHIFLFTSDNIIIITKEDVIKNDIYIFT